MEKAVLIIIDGGGVGYLPDANEYGDVGANTFGNIFKKVKKNNLHNLSKLGLMNLISKKKENAIGSPSGFVLIDTSSTTVAPPSICCRNSILYGPSDPCVHISL